MTRRRKKSFRMRFTFWLDDLRQDESELIGYIEELKIERRFVTTVRDGLRLIRDLRAGRVDVLLTLFPTVARQLQPDNSELLTLISGLMVSQTPTAITSLPPVNVPAVVKVDETKARQVTLQNTLASLEDF